MEKVNHPSHYNVEGKKECIEQMLDTYGSYFTCIFCLTNCYKYLYRAGEKPNESVSDDISKAKWYFNYACNRLGEELLSTDTIALLYYDVRKEILPYYGEEYYDPR